LQVNASVMRVDLGTPMIDDPTLERWGLVKAITPRAPGSLEDLYQGVPLRYPRHFEALCLSHQWESASLGEIELAENPPGKDLRSLAAAVRYDRLLWGYLVSKGYLIFGRRSGGRYDPVAFDLNQTNREQAPIVWVDHEEILSFERLGTPKVLAPSIEALLQEGASPK